MSEDAGPGATDAQAGSDGASWFADAPSWTPNETGSSEPVHVDVPVCEVPAEVSAFVDQMATALCDGFASCCVSQSYTFDAATCRQQIVGSYAAYLPKSCVKLDAGRAAACLQALHAPDPMCNEDPEDFHAYFESACDGVIGGTLPLGSACNSSLDCAIQPDGYGECTLGVGETVAYCLLENFSRQLGESCTFSSKYSCDATKGLWCDWSSKCRARGKEGETCGFGVSDYSSPCAEGLYCSDSTGECEVYESVGATCGEEYACGWKARCDASHVCVALAGAGEACSADADCASKKCVDSTCRPYLAFLYYAGAESYCSLP